MSWLVPKRFKLIFRTQPDYLTDALVLKRKFNKYSIQEFEIFIYCNYSGHERENGVVS